MPIYWETDVRKNKKVAMLLLFIFAAQAIGIFALVGWDLDQIKIGDVPLFRLILFFGSAWILLGLKWMRIGGHA